MGSRGCKNTAGVCAQTDLHRSPPGSGGATVLSRSYGPEAACGIKKAAHPGVVWGGDPSLLKAWEGLDTLLPSTQWQPLTPRSSQGQRTPL